MNDKIKFVKSAFYISLLLFILDYGIGKTLNYLYFRQVGIDDRTTTYVADHCNQDLLIFGSSRACQHYISNDIAKKTNLSCFNAGLAGYNIFYSYGLLKCVLARYTPKVVILDLLPEEFDVNEVYHDRIAALLPYYQNHKEIRDVIKLKSRFENIKLLSKIYPFNNLVLETISKNLHRYSPNEITKRDQNGFEANDGVVDEKGDKFVNTDFDSSPLDSDAVNTYKSFINDCLSRHIKLYIFVSPILVDFKLKRPSTKLAAKIAAINKVPFFDYSDSVRFKNKKYFYNLGHLNVTGAKIYTSTVENILVKY
ncbi:hypothetical protein JN11_01865 [Mucilaginibacter frigoritolerans]|uniref:Uncharacterized protein n=1 Tax=Mucilaginibacter frigoritolerans TaxID=652788 RepID=A0A562U922_9SPHI|nr:hypothetical protein [Mucilaginibacter frigoritolerans]TWJ01711.1 hypothetical protein JN11_01865 [Mucilaginibacter frigoritolerans]